MIQNYGDIFSAFFPDFYWSSQAPPWFKERLGHFFKIHDLSRETVTDEHPFERQNARLLNCNRSRMVTMNGWTVEEKIWTNKVE